MVEMVEMMDKKANREYKDSIFTKLCEDKTKVIEIYNAVSGKDYPLDTEIEIVTLDDVLFLDRRNDVAFVVESKLVVLIEHQSTLCENMPIRLLIYIARVYEKLFNVDPKLKQGVYKTKLMKIPKPEFYVLYNGEEKSSERKGLKLSDAFLTEDTQEELRVFLELVVPIFNMNEGHNEAITKKSKTLSDYAAFVASVRRSLESGDSLEEAIVRAIKDCIGKNILVEFLQAHSSEVVNMLTAEFKMEEAIKVWKEEGREEGIEKVARGMLVEGVPMDIIVRSSGLSLDTIKAMMN